MKNIRSSQAAIPFTTLNKTLVKHSFSLWVLLSAVWSKINSLVATVLGTLTISENNWNLMSKKNNHLNLLKTCFVYIAAVKR